MKPVVEINDVDRRVYDEKLRDFLPEKVIDIHTHVWLDSLKKNVKRDRVVTWPSLVGAHAQGCPPCGSAVKPRSWGAIKAIYR